MFNFIFTADKASKKPLYEQLYSYVADEIKNKNIKENERMPSKKALAKYLGISVNTVETAYSILVQEGYLRAVARSGFYVCKVDIPVGDRNFEYEEEQESVTAYKADFKTNKVDINSFPYSTWIKLSKEVMYSTPEYLNSGNVKGDYELRESIAKYLHEFRGVKCSPMQIVVGAGAVLAKAESSLNLSNKELNEASMYIATWHVLLRLRLLSAFARTAPAPTTICIGEHFTPRNSCKYFAILSLNS